MVMYKTTKNTQLFDMFTNELIFDEMFIKGADEGFFIEQNIYTFLYYNQCWMVQCKHVVVVVRYFNSRLYFSAAFIGKIFLTKRR